MWRLHRYVLGSVILASLGGVGLFVFLLITGNAMRDSLEMLARGQITGNVFFQMVGLLVPYAVSYAMPLGTLVGILLVVGRLSANQELTAMRASGISIWRIAAPVLLFAMLAACFNAWINAYYAPSARSSYREIIRNVVRTDPLRFIVERTFVHDFPGYVFFASEKDGSDLEDLWVWELDDELRVVRLVRADRGSLRYEPETDGLILHIESAFAELRDAADPDNLRQLRPTIFVGETSIRFSLAQILGRAEPPTRLAHLTIPQRLARRAELIGASSRATGPDEQQQVRHDLIQVQYRIQESLAMGYSVFALALLGIPLGIKASRSETPFNVVFALGIALSYYVAMVVIGWAEHSPHLRPDLLVWVPNILCQFLGLWLLFRANRR